MALDHEKDARAKRVKAMFCLLGKSLETYKGLFLYFLFVLNTRK